MLTYDGVDVFLPPIVYLSTLIVHGEMAKRGPAAPRLAAKTEEIERRV